LTHAAPRGIPPKVRRPFATGLVLFTLSAWHAAFVSAEPARWTPVPLKSFVAFDATHPLGDFSGRAEQLAGEITVDPSDLKQGTRGHVVIAVKALATGTNRRDRDLRRTLEADRHPDIRYAIEGVEASFDSLTERSDVTLTIRGMMTIRGVDRLVTFAARARRRDDRIWVRGESSVRLSDFGVAPPRRLLLSVGDDVAIRFDLLFQRGTPASPARP
jgi:polyisoprenoid-binding protein YceI